MRIMPIINNQTNPRTQRQNQKNQPSFKAIIHIETKDAKATQWLQNIIDKQLPKILEYPEVKKVITRIGKDGKEIPTEGNLVIHVRAISDNFLAEWFQFTNQVQDYTSLWKNKDVAKHEVSCGKVAEETKMIEYFEQRFNMTNVVETLKG